MLMGKTIVLGNMPHSKVVIQDNSILIHRNTKKLGKETTGIVYIMSNVAIELGRPLKQFISALNNTRIPVVLQKVVTRGLFENYKVTRINTGNVPNVDLGIIEVYNGMIVGYIFDQKTLRNRDLLKYVKISALNRLCIRNTEDTSKNIESALRIILKTKNTIKHQSKKKIIVFAVKSKAYKMSIEYKCVLGKDDKYTIRSVSLPSSVYIN